MTASIGRPVHKNAERWRWLLYVALAITGALLTLLEPGRSRSAENTGFRKLIDSYCEAWSTGTANTPAKFYAKDNGLVFYDVGSFRVPWLEGISRRSAEGIPG